MGLVERNPIPGYCGEIDNLVRWRKTPGLHSEDAWRHFLSTLKMDDESFSAALRYDLASERAGDWVAKTLRLPSAPRDLLGGDALVHAWITDARRELGRAIKSINRREGATVVAMKVATGLAIKLQDELLELAIRPVILEAEIFERLDGLGTHQAYLHALSSRVAQLNLFGHYPGLAMAFATTCERWLSSSIEFLERFVHDRSKITTLVGATKLVRLRGASYADCDPHFNGRRVIISNLDDRKRVVYKPRSLAAFDRFQMLLVWLNDQGFEFDLQPLRVICQKDWGWVEFVASIDCKTQDEISAFYYRAGRTISPLILTRRHGLPS